MARKKPAPAAADATPPMSGKVFWFDRKIRSWERDRDKNRVVALGGTVDEDVDASVNVLVLAESQRGSTSTAEKKATKLGLAVDVHYAADTAALLCPSREFALAILAGGPTNADRWAAIQPSPRGTVRIDLDGADLSGLDLSGFQFTQLLDGVKLDGTNLGGATISLKNTRCKSKFPAILSLGLTSDCNFDGHESPLAFTGHLLRTSFRKARLSGSHSNNITCEDCDFTGADLSGSRFGMWTTLVAAAPKKQTLDFAEFFERLPKVVRDTGRIRNAVSMLRAETFSLFAETTDAQVVGIVRSQSSKERVYACRLNSVGQFECGTQNLRACGGLRGSVCKHLLVLIVGLTKSGTLDAGSALQWLQLSQRQQPTFDKEAMTATFLKYAGVQSGEVDWRPTETVPEDYYAL